VTVTYRRSLVFHWTDPRGGRSVVAYNALSNVGADLSEAELDFAATMQLISGCVLDGVMDCRWMAFGDAGEPTPYGQVEDRVLFSGLSTTRNGVRILVPAPISEIFDASTLQASMSHPSVTSLVDASKLAISDTNGAALSRITRGTRCDAVLGRRG
jgi:hypothetical protein